MTFDPPNWEQLGALDDAALKKEMFSIVQRAAMEVQVGELDDPELLATVPRLADLIARRVALSDLSEVLASLARSTGLWNYIDKKSADSRDQLVAELATESGLGGITLHREQVAA